MTRPASLAVAVAVPTLWLASGIATLALGQQYLDVTPLTPSQPTALDGLAAGLDDRLVLLVTLVLYVTTWILTAQVSLGPRRQGMLVLLWAAPVLLAPPVLSADVFAYGELGWFQHVGTDPYSAVLHSNPASPFFDGTACGQGQPPRTPRRHSGSSGSRGAWRDSTRTGRRRSCDSSGSSQCWRPCH